MEIILTILLTAAIVSLFWWISNRSAKDKSVSIAEDLSTMRQQLQKTWTEMEHHRDAVFDAMAEGVLLCDLSGKILFWNRACRRLFNLPENPLDGMTLLEALRLHEVLEVFERTLEKGRTMGVELKPRGGASLHLMLNAVVVDHSSGKPDSVLLIFHDLTQLRELENARRDFVANVSHELRTPLSMIKGFVETVMDHPEMDLETRVNFLGKVQKHSDRLSLLIEDLLTISKLESGQATVNLQDVHLRGEVARVLSDLERGAQAKQMRVNLDIANDIRVKVDVDLLDQIIINLVDNAIKYGRQGGRVEVKANRNGNDQVCIGIADDGPGIPPESLDRIFERFFRVDKARSRSQGGTGLGLSIVKHIAQALGGRVWAESELGHGTTFFFTLKRSDALSSQTELQLDKNLHAASSARE